MCDDKNVVILVVDDSEDNLFLMELVLTGDGYKVEKACCGKEGLDKIHQLVPDLIILDLMMPDMTGIEVADAIKANKHLSHIPILLCTANTSIGKNDVMGVDDVYYKPIDIAEMLARIKSFVSY